MAWRDPRFGRPVSLRSRFGQTRRRTVLMEMDADTGPVVALPQPTNLSDDQLRALDALSAARRAGYVTEAEYRRRYLLVLENRLSDAGYSPATP